jgi:predicted HicB family RNase H-like nuclease
MRTDATEPWVQLATRIPKSLHRALKLFCVQADTSVMEFVTTALQEKLRRDAARSAASRRAKR